MRRFRVSFVCICIYWVILVAGAGLHAESLVVPVAIATSMAFMLPVATPPSALVYSSGYVTQRDMMRSGLRLNLAAIAVITLLFHFGLAG